MSLDTETLSNRTFEATSNRVAGHLHILLITTGSVASVKAPSIIEGLLEVTRDDITTESAQVHSVNALGLHSIRMYAFRSSLLNCPLHSSIAMLSNRSMLMRE